MRDRGGWVADRKRKLELWMNSTTMELVLMGLIVVSVVLTILEVVLTGRAHWLVTWANNILTSVFIVELSLRYWTARKKARFFERYWIDILAVLPFIRPLRFLRVLRVLRLLRAGVLFNRRIAQSRRPGNSGPEFLGLSLATVMLIVMCAMILTTVEGGEGMQFESFETALWFAAYSLIGGEPIGGSPVSEVGRWTTMVLMLGGLTLFGVFVGTVSAGMVAGLSRRLEVHDLDIDELSSHVVVCGWSESAPWVLAELFGTQKHGGLTAVLLTEKEVPAADIPASIPLEHLYQHIGDYTRVDVLEAVNIQEASRVVLLADELIRRSAQDCDARTVLAALTVERMNPGIYTVAMLHHRQNEELLKMAGVEEIVVGDLFNGMIVGSVSRNRGLVQILDEILTGTRGQSFYTIKVPDALDGSTVRELYALLHDQHQAVLISVESDGKPVVNPPPDTVVPAGTRLVLLALTAPKL